MTVMRLSSLVQKPSLEQTCLVGSAPDVVWEIDIGSAVGKSILDSVVSVAKGKYRAGTNLLRKLKSLRGTFRELRTVPDAAEKVVIGLYGEGNRIHGFVLWFDKDSGYAGGEVAKNPSEIDRHRAFRS
jgi:hypothetical protein